VTNNEFSQCKGQNEAFFRNCDFRLVLRKWVTPKLEVLVNIHAPVKVETNNYLPMT